jgi:uncharacterized protein (DUF1778 family)
MENLLKKAGDTFQTAVLPAGQEAFCRMGDYVKTAALPAAQEVIFRGNDYLKTAVLPAAEEALCRGDDYLKTAVLPAAEEALSRGNDYLITAALPAAQEVLSRGNDYMKTAVLPAATQAGASINTAARQLWEGQGDTSLKDLVGPTLDSLALAISPAVKFIADNPLILLPALIPLLLPALEMWVTLAGFAIEGVRAGEHSTKRGPTASSLLTNTGRFYRGRDRSYHRGYS